MQDLLGIDHIDMKLFDMIMSYYRKRCMDALVQVGAAAVHVRHAVVGKP